MDIRRKFVAGIVGLLAVMGVGSAAVAQQATVPQSSNQPAVVAPVSQAGQIESSQADSGAIQQGDQTAPDTAEAVSAESGSLEQPGAEAAETGAEATEAAGETSGVEEAGDANLPGGGHADADGQQIDHQFEGNE